MRSKTVIAMAVAGALSVPFVTFARDRAEVRTPVSVNEAGDARVQRQDDRLVRDHHALAHQRSWEVQTPLSIPEAGAADSWSQHAQLQRIPARDTLSSSVYEQDMTTRESASFSSSQDSMAFEERGNDTLALADQGVYSDYYLVGVPQTAGADYYIVESRPAPLDSRDVILLVPME